MDLDLEHQSSNRILDLEKRAPLRFGKRAPMRFGKRGDLENLKILRSVRAPMVRFITLLKMMILIFMQRFGKRSDDFKRAPLRFGKRFDDDYNNEIVLDYY